MSSERPRKRKYISDTEAGIRTITQIKNLPSCELTDEEFVKEFFDRFEAKAMIMIYVDGAGEFISFGRLKHGLKPFSYYRMLMAKVSALFETSNIKEVE